MSAYVPAVDRFWPKVDFSGDCWEWKASKYRNGYGQFSEYRGKKLLAHRFAYETLVGKVGSLELDHLCRNRACVNPDHLEPVTRLVNTRRALKGRKRPVEFVPPERCPVGHKWEGRRPSCRVCERIANRQPSERRTLFAAGKCIRGHDLDFVTSQGKRGCRTCSRERTRAWQEKQRANAV